MKPDKLRAAADKMTATVEDKLNPSVGNQNWTARRQAEADRIRKDGKRLQTIQHMLYGMADAIESGSLPSELVGLKLGTKVLLEDIVIWDIMPGTHSQAYKRVLKAGITPDTYESVRAALFSITHAPDTSNEDEARRIYNETRRLVGKIPGFFPTPESVARKLVDLADIDDTTTILEPSCGSGSILSAIASKVGTLANVTAIEINPTLAQHTRNVHKIDVIQEDFTEWVGNGGFDRVIMNPPFEKFQDVDHVTKALSHLNPGGRLVSVMSPSWTFQNTKKAETFRALVCDRGEVINLDDGAFKESGTGVRSVVVVLEA